MKENTQAYIARLEMEVDLLKNFHTELRRNMLVKHNIGQSTISKKTLRESDVLFF
ncbi:MAG: hypothetical protein AB2L18_07170 [Anaerolineaceae bacterium]